MIDANSSLEDIANAIAEKEKELREAIINRGILTQDINKISTDILHLEIAKKELSIPLSKARDSVRLIESDLRDLRQMFWGKKE